MGFPNELMFRCLGVEQESIKCKRSKRQTDGRPGDGPKDRLQLNEAISGERGDVQVGSADFFLAVLAGAVLRKET